MKLATAWKRNAARRKRNRPTSPSKIRWKLLGLSDPDLTEPTSIETVRREVLWLASRGFGQGTKSRSSEQDAQKRGQNRQTGGKRIRRPEATE
jgi:hypothetical protein